MANARWHKPPKVCSLGTIKQKMKIDWRLLEEDCGVLVNIGFSIAMGVLFTITVAAIGLSGCIPSILESDTSVLAFVVGVFTPILLFLAFILIVEFLVFHPHRYTVGFQIGYLLLYIFDLTVVWTPTLLWHLSVLSLEQTQIAQIVCSIATSTWTALLLCLSTYCGLGKQTQTECESHKTRKVKERDGKENRRIQHQPSSRDLGYFDSSSSDSFDVSEFSQFV